MKVSIKNCGAGVNKDLLGSELDPGTWSDSSNMRFRNGFAEKRKGIQTAYTTPAATPYALFAYLTNTARFIVEAGIANVYVDDGTTQTKITRLVEGSVIASITNSTTTATLNTSTAHGLSTGATVTVYGVTPSAYNGVFTITVTDADTFTYTMLSDPGGSATVVGEYSTSVSNPYTGAIDDRWTGGVFNGVLTLNNAVDAPQYWAGDIAMKLRKLPGWPTGQKCDALRSFKNYLIALAPTISGTKQQHTILWSESSEPGALPTAWTATDVNDAGDSPQAAETGGTLVDGLPLGDVFIAYKQDARFGIQYIGGNDVFRIFRLPGSDGLMARGCVVDTPKGHVFLTSGDVKLHSGGEAISIAEGRIRTWLFQTMDTTYANRSFVCLNPQKTEVWIVFPSYGQTSCDTVAAWNWTDDTWGIYSVSALTCGTAGLVASGLVAVTWASDSESWDSDGTTWTENEYSPNESRLILGTNTPRIGLAETGTTDFGSTIPWYLEKKGITLDDSDSIKIPHRSRPQIKALAGTVVNVYHGTAMTADAAPTYSAVSAFTVGTTNWADAFASGGRFMAQKFVGSGAQPVALRSYDLEFEKGGDA